MSTEPTTPAGALAPAGPADRRDRIADALNKADAWAQLQRRDDRERFADAAMAALPELPAHDQLRERLAALADGWDSSARAFLMWAAEHSRRKDTASARVARVRAEMCTHHARQLRALLEDL